MEVLIAFGVLFALVAGIGIYRLIKTAIDRGLFDRHTPIGDLNDVHGKDEDYSYEQKVEEEEHYAKIVAEREKEEKIAAEQEAKIVVDKTEQKVEVLENKSEDDKLEM